ncbi:hypothetical protein HQ531_12715 [bacterium]|nr:hypothetical protein [bacterium]
MRWTNPENRLDRDCCIQYWFGQKTNPMYSQNNEDSYTLGGIAELIL